MRQTGRATQIAAGKQPAQLSGALAVVIHKTQQQLAVQFAVAAYGCKASLHIDRLPLRH